ncbi:MAG: peptide MFS transporter [Proteobacteria bacterium]|nr:peptide MFS transporter [Pseudomonadota bacterium]
MPEPDASATAPLATHALPAGGPRRRRHPRGLRVLFITELWERFSFYGMRSLLTLYMTRVLRYSDRRAYGVYGAYGALVYACPLAGGVLADRLLGYRVAVLLGAVLMALGHFVMAIRHELALYVALALLCLGNGFFKPNISSLVGRLYATGDPRRDAGFTIFYMGINAGAFLAPLICGSLGERVDWHWGFGLAGIGMLVALLWFGRGRAALEGHGEPPSLEALRARRWLGRSALQLIVLGSLAAVPLLAFALRRPELVAWLLYGAGAAVYGGLVWVALRSDAQTRGRLLLALVLMACSTVFWALFEQAGSSLTLFAARNVDRSLAHGPIGALFRTLAPETPLPELPASVLQAANPLFLLALGLPAAALWTTLNRRGSDPSVPTKFGVALLQLGLGYLVLVAGTAWADAQGRVALRWLLGLYLLHTSGELCLSPIGLSAMTRLAPPHLAGTLMGAWFLASSYSHHFGGLIAAMTALPSSTGTDATAPAAAAALQLYVSVFARLGYLALGVGALLLVSARWLQRPLRGID